MISPRSILVFSGGYHIIFNALLVNNCIICDIEQILKSKYMTMFVKKRCVRHTIEMGVHIDFFLESCDTSVASLCPNTAMPSH